MSATRRVILAGLLVFLGFVVFHSVTPWSWSAPQAAPAGVTARQVSYTCGPLWGSGYVHGPPSTAYPLQGTPCAHRASAQLVSGVDVAIALAGVAVVAAGALRPRQPQES
ncbi:MAG TPA: hypothetical protein VKU88_07825 [Acidimicrobiales bacterium]|nr:hypothetical protein [Acidimicrobiales bacterium]